MCGISGFYNHDGSFCQKYDYYMEILKKMNRLLAHRGPDNNGTLLCQKCGFSHTRLSIRDISGGLQPMTRSVDGHEIHIIYNGEIYNADELRLEQEQLGYEFTTTSDTEVILNGFLEFGADYVLRLNGIFAYSIYDSRHDSLYLFRDSFGIKPLYYTFQNQTIIFSSEIKCLFTYPGVKAVIDSNGINEIFTLGPAKSYGSGVFKGIYEVKPGTYLCYNRYGTHHTTYWRLMSKPHTDSYDETVEHTGMLVTDAIKRQMVSDVPIATFLSGGIDSSIVSAVCARELQKSHLKLTTFSFDFEGNSKNFKANMFQPSMDRPYVEKMVEYIGSDHHYLECDKTELHSMLYDSVISRDMPTMADVDSSLLYFCKIVSRTHKVVLTGECADEIFAGYPWFHKEELLKSFSNGKTFPWTPTLDPRKAVLKDDVIAKLNMDEYSRNALYSSLKEINILPGDNNIETSRRQISYLNIKWFMQTLLDRMDRTSMYSGLEARVPFADRRIVEYIFNVPFDMKTKDGVVKGLLHINT